MITCNPLCSERTPNGFCKHSACIKPTEVLRTQENAIIFFPYTVGLVTFQNREELEGWIVARQAEMEAWRFEQNKLPSHDIVHNNIQR